MNNLDSHLDEDWSSASDLSTMQDLATWWQRLFALVVDSVLISVVSGVVLLITAVVELYLAPPTATPTTLVTPSLPAPSTPISGVYWKELIGIGIASILYFAILDGRSQTLGKRMFGIAVCDQATGQPIGVPRALLRWVIFIVLWGIFFMPGLLNALSPSWDWRRQAWHDHAVGSVVLEVD